MSDYDIVIVGCGVFGLSTSLELVRKNYRVLALDAFEPPSPWSAANDLNKIIRIEYPDTLSASLAVEALKSWKNDPLYSKFFVETGRLTLSPSNTSSSRTIYEQKSLENLKKLGTEQRIQFFSTRKQIAANIPEFSKNNLPEILQAAYNLDCGTGLSAQAITAVYHEARILGVSFAFGDDGNAVNISSCKVAVKSGKTYSAKKILVTTGAATPSLIPLDAQISPWAAFVTHIQLTKEEYEKYKNMPIFFSAEYGYFFPPDSQNHKIKLALTTCDGFAEGTDPFDKNRGTIRIAKYDIKKNNVIPVAHSQDAKNLLHLLIPELEGHELVDSKTCWTADSSTNKFLIDKCPYYENVYVASGDSSHAFKFLPTIGKYIVQKLEGSLSDELNEAWKWKVMPDFSGKLSSRQPRPHLNLDDDHLFQ